jgi:hypothetical protein
MIGLLYFLLRLRDLWPGLKPFCASELVLKQWIHWNFGRTAWAANPHIVRTGRHRKTHISMLKAGYEPRIPLIERFKSYMPWIGLSLYLKDINLLVFLFDSCFIRVVLRIMCVVELLSLLFAHLYGNNSFHWNGHGGLVNKVTLRFWRRRPSEQDFVFWILTSSGI